VSPGTDEGGEWVVSTEAGLWLARVRLDQELVPVGFSGSREMAEAMAVSIAAHAQANRLRRDTR
jgi:hypothetical protein